MPNVLKKKKKKCSTPASKACLIEVGILELSKSISKKGKSGSKKKKKSYQGQIVEDFLIHKSPAFRSLLCLVLAGGWKNFEKKLGGWIGLLKFRARTNPLGVSITLNAEALIVAERLFLSGCTIIL